MVFVIDANSVMDEIGFFLGEFVVILTGEGDQWEFFVLRRIEQLDGAGVWVFPRAFFSLHFWRLGILIVDF